MIKEKLLNSAAELRQPDKKSTDEFSRKKLLLVERMNNLMINRSDINDMVGENNIEMMKDNHSNHIRFMESVFTNYDPQVFVDTILWVFRAYRSRNFSSTYFAAIMNNWMNIYKEELSENSYNKIIPFYNWIQINIPVFNNIAEKEIDTKLSSK